MSENSKTQENTRLNEVVLKKGVSVTKGYRQTAVILVIVVQVAVRVGELESGSWQIDLAVRKHAASVAYVRLQAHVLGGGGEPVRRGRTKARHRKAARTTVRQVEVVVVVDEVLHTSPRGRQTSAGESIQLPVRTEGSGALSRINPEAAHGVDASTVVVVVRPEVHLNSDEISAEDRYQATSSVVHIVELCSENQRPIRRNDLSGSRRNKD